MNATPRVRSGHYPQSPATLAPRARGDPSSPSPSPAGPPKQQRAPRPSLPPAPETAAAAPSDRPPLIPLTIIDAPSQRLYAVAIYILLFAWRLFDWVKLVEDDVGSFMHFTKWVGMDFVFLFIGLPTFRIPWLDPSQPVVVTIFFLQFVLNWALMFNIQLPWTAWLLGMVKIFYDREVAISEHNVKISSVLNNHSIIMGKQIINILPEG